MSRYMNNDQTMDLFRSLDEIKNSTTLTQPEKEKCILDMHNKIINGLSFLVLSQVRRYRKFGNYEDILQEGKIGLIKAVKRFDHSRFPNFFVYAERWIKNHVRRTASRFDVVYNPNKSRVVYGDAEIENEIDENGPEEVFFIKERRSIIASALGSLTDREGDVIERVFGLDEEPQTLREIGPAFGLTHERIRQIKNEAILKLTRNTSLADFINK